MAAEGAPIEVVDEAMKRWGMSMGPFEMLDEMGLDVGINLLKSPSLVQSPDLPLPDALDQAVARGWLGRKTGIGFYIHEELKARRGEAKARPNIQMFTLIALRTESEAAAASPSTEGIQWRLVLPMVNAAARALSEGVTDSADDIDLATVLGFGFAPFRGGLAKFVEDAGVGPLLRRLDELAARLGPRFTPAELLRGMARENRLFARPLRERSISRVSAPPG